MPSVIPPEGDDGVVQQAELLDLVQDAAKLVVGVGKGGVVGASQGLGQLLGEVEVGKSEVRGEVVGPDVLVVPEVAIIVPGQGWHVLGELQKKAKFREFNKESSDFPIQSLVYVHVL